MDKIINFGIPHIAEQIFEQLSYDELKQCVSVSETWKAFAEPIFFKHWQEKLLGACISKPSTLKQLCKAMDIQKAFAMACKCGYTDIVEILLDHPNTANFFNAKDESGETALISACIQRNHEIVTLLLGHPMSTRIDFNATDLTGKTAFMQACLFDGREIVKIMLDYPRVTQTEEVLSNGYRRLKRKYININFNAKDIHGRTGFMLACYYGHKNVVKLLLDHSERIELNARDDFGKTAFMWSCENGRKDVVKLFVQHSKTKGIDISTRKELSDDMRAFIDNLQ